MTAIWHRVVFLSISSSKSRPQCTISYRVVSCQTLDAVFCKNCISFAFYFDHYRFHIQLFYPSQFGLIFIIFLWLFGFFIFIYKVWHSEKLLGQHYMYVLMPYGHSIAISIALAYTIYNGIQFFPSEFFLRFFFFSKFHRFFVVCQQHIRHFIVHWLCQEWCVQCETGPSKTWERI